MTRAGADPADAVVGCVVLAAGSSRRFGSDKRAYRLPNGLTLLEQTLAVLQPAFEHRVLVLAPGDTSLAAQFRANWHIVMAADASEGMGHSLAAAVPHFRAWSATVIALADMPWITMKTLQLIRRTLTPDTLVVPFYKGQRGNPVGIGAAYFPELADLRGDAGARMLFQRHADHMVRLDVSDPGILQDMDTPP